VVRESTWAAAMMALGRTRKATNTPKEIIFEGMQEILDMAGYRKEEEEAADLENRIVVGMDLGRVDEEKHQSELRVLYTNSMPVLILE
jgi:hypothetical protein